MTEARKAGDPDRAMNSLAGFRWDGVSPERDSMAPGDTVRGAREEPGEHKVAGQQPRMATPARAQA